MSLSTGFSRIQKRVHRAGEKVKKTLVQLCGPSSPKTPKRERNKLRKTRKPTESPKDKSSSPPPSSDDNTPPTPATAAPFPVNPPQEPAAESTNPYERVAHHLCQALVAHIRAHYPEPPSPTCSCGSSGYSSSDCSHWHCHSDLPTSYTGTTSMTSADQEKPKVTAPPDSYYIDRSARRNETKQKKSTAPRVVSSPVQQPPPSPRNQSTFCSPSTSPYRTVSCQIPSTTRSYNPNMKYDDHGYSTSRPRIPRRPLPDPKEYDTRIFAWLREVPEQQHPLRRKPKVDNMSPRNRSREAGLGLGTIME